MKRYTRGLMALSAVTLLAVTLWAALPAGYPGARSFDYSLSVYLQNGMNVAQMLYNNVKGDDFNKVKAAGDANDLMARLEYARRDADSMNVSASPEDMKAIAPYMDSLNMHLNNIAQDLKVVNEQLASAQPNDSTLADYAADLYWQFHDAEMNDHKEIMGIRHVNEMEKPPRKPMTPSY